MGDTLLIMMLALVLGLAGVSYFAGKWIRRMKSNAAALELVHEIARHAANRSSSHRPADMIEHEGMTDKQHPAIKAVVDLARQMERAEKQAELRLATMISSIHRPVLLVSRSGKVVTSNASARNILGADQVACGTSVLAALNHWDMARIMQAGADGETDFPTHIHDVTNRLHPVRVTAIRDLDDICEGWIIRFVGQEHDGATTGDVDIQISQLEAAPALPPHGTRLPDDLPVSDIPFIILDSETTGLDRQTSRMISVAAVRAHGFKLHTADVLDKLIDPGIEVPLDSTVVHGITTAMVSGKPDFAMRWPVIRDFVGGAVLVGHHIDFDVQIIRNECKRNAVDWTVPPVLDTARLYARLTDSDRLLTLDQLAKACDVSIYGRHTALGDTLVTAEIFIKLLEQARSQGYVTLQSLSEIGSPQATEAG
ncbi:MAG: hypothetical protein Alpg2KO_03050 [Alphaproteobacteria bacterium]